MNNKQVMDMVKEKLNLSDESLSIFSDIVNDIPLIGKTNKEKMTTLFVEKLGVSKEAAEHYYEVFSEIIMSGVKDKLKHPFKNLDK